MGLAPSVHRTHRVRHGRCALICRRHGHGLGYYFFEQLIVALFSSLFSWFQNVADFMLVRNISAWTGATGGFPGTGALPDATQAIIVLAVYTLILLGVAFWLFERRDVQGATGGG